MASSRQGLPLPLLRRPGLPSARLPIMRALGAVRCLWERLVKSAHRLDLKKKKNLKVPVQLMKKWARILSWVIVYYMLYII